jgi:tRNA-Thr(GGU) m(6)t(6)A37 methyltransferase TsaA
MVAVLAGSNGGSVGGVYGVARLSQVPQSLGEYNLQVLGEIHSCFKQKFGIPRQPGLAPLATAELELKKSVALVPTVFLHFVLFRNNPSTACSSITTWYHLLSFTDSAAKPQSWRPTAAFWLLFGCPVLNFPLLFSIVRPWSHPDAVRGIEGWSHLWITFIFHEVNLGTKFKSTVHPPRGDQKYGVFATRTTHRPNRLGLSLVELVGVDIRTTGTVLKLAGVDLLDGTPVVDIKPYLPYADVVLDARAGFAPEEPPSLAVEFSAEAEAELAECRSKHPQLKQLAVQVLSQDPRPTYYKRGAADHQQSFHGKEHCLHLCDIRLAWRHVSSPDSEPKIVVHKCSRLPPSDTPKLFR